MIVTYLTSLKVKAFIVSHLTDEEKEQYEYIRSQIVRSTACGKRPTSFMDRVLNVTAQSNPGILKEYAEHLMRDMTKILEDVVGEGESSSTIPDDPDTPLIIKILLSSLKLPLSIKTEIKEEVETAEEKDEEKQEETETVVEEEEPVKSDSGIEEISLDEAEKINRPEVMKVIDMLKEGSQKQLEAYNHLVEAVPMMSDSEVKEVVKSVLKPDIGIPYVVLEVFDEYGEQNFRHMLAVGQHLFEQFTSNTTGEKVRSLLKICMKLNVSGKVHEIMNGE